MSWGKCTKPKCFICICEVRVRLLRKICQPTQCTANLVPESQIPMCACVRSCFCGEKVDCVKIQFQSHSTLLLSQQLQSIRLELSGIKSAEYICCFCFLFCFAIGGVYGCKGFENMPMEGRQTTTPCRWQPRSFIRATIINLFKIIITVVIMNHHDDDDVNNKLWWWDILPWPANASTRRLVYRKPRQRLIFIFETQVTGI